MKISVRGSLYFVIMTLFIFLNETCLANAYYAEVVKYNCDQENSVITVQYRNIEYENATELNKILGNNAWKLFSLVKSKDGQHADGVSIIQRTCHLEGGNYEVSIGPVLGNTNIQGKCGGEISAYVEITHAGKSLGHYQFGGKMCDYAKVEWPEEVTDVNVSSTPPFDYVKVTTVRTKKFGNSPS